MITWEHPLHTKARRRANLAPVPRGWARKGDLYVHESGEVSQDHPLFRNFLNELVNTTRVSLSHQPAYNPSPHKEDMENYNGNGRESEGDVGAQEQIDPEPDSDVPSSDQLRQRRQELAGMNWENHSLKLEIKYLKRKLTRVVYGEKPPPKSDRTSRFRRKTTQSPNTSVSNGPQESSTPQYKGPFYGVPLDELLQHEGDGAKIPYIPRTLLDFLESDAIVCTEGIFRLSPSLTQLQAVKDKINKGEPIDLEVLRDDPHIAAALLKQFLRDLPNPILTPSTQTYSQFLEIQQNSQKDALPQLKVLIASLPKANRVFLRRLADVVQKVAANSDKNKMGATALGVVFGSNIMRTKGEGSSELDRSISRSSGRLSSFSKSPNSLKEEMQKLQHINHLTTTLFSNPSLFGPAESDSADRTQAQRTAPPRATESSDEGLWGEGWGWSFQGPKFSVQSEEQKLAHNQHTQYSHFLQHRHVYAQLIRTLQAQPYPLAIAGLQLEKMECRSLASLAAYTLYDPLTVDGLTSWRWLAEVAAAWAGVSCTELCEDVYGERVGATEKQIEEFEIEDDGEEDELFNFDEGGSPPLPKFKVSEKREGGKTNEISPAPFLAYVLMYFAKNREFVEYLRKIVKPVLQNLLHAPEQLDLKFIESAPGAAKSFIGVEIDIEALQTITTSVLEAILLEDAIALIPADIVFVCRLLYKTGKFDQDPQYLFRWFFFRLYLLSAFASPEEYELCEDMTPSQQQVLRCVECVLTQVAHLPPSFPCPSHTRALRPEDEALQYHITKLCEYDLQGYVSRYRTSVDALGQRIVLSPIVLHPLYKPPEFTGVVSTSLVEIYTLHRILLNLTFEKENIGKGAPLRLILETIREPPSSLRDEDDVFVIVNLTNFISNLPTFSDKGEINTSEKNAANAELDSIARMAAELKQQKQTFEASQQKSSMQMRNLSESIRKLTTNVERHTVLLTQVVQDYTQLRDAITLAHKYRKDLQSTKTMLAKKLQLAFLDLLAAKQPEDIYPKSTRAPEDYAANSPFSGKRPSSPMRSISPSHSRPSTPSHSRPSTPSQPYARPSTPSFTRPPTPTKRPPTPPSSASPVYPFSTSPFSSSSPSPVPPDPQMKATASNFLERLANQNPSFPHSGSFPHTSSFPASGSTSSFPPPSPPASSTNPLANLLASQFDVAVYKTGDRG